VIDDRRFIQFASTHKKVKHTKRKSLKQK